MGWLLVKDLQILRRSPLLVVLLIAYAVVIGLPVGYAVSSPPSKPKVAFLNEVPKSQDKVQLGGGTVDASKYANELFKAITPVRVKTRAEAIAKVKSGDALAALIVPANATQALQSLANPIGPVTIPKLEIYYNAENPLKQRYVESTIKARLADANEALSDTLTKFSAEALTVLLKGGTFPGLGTILGLERTRTILLGVEAAFKAGDPRRTAIDQVAKFAQVAITNLNFAQPVLKAISRPIQADVHIVRGRSGSLNGFAVAAAVAIALLFTGILSAAGLLALEREEHTFGRLVRGLVGRSALVAEKIAIGGICAAVVGLLLVVILGLFEHVDYGRAPEWLAALVLGALGFGALGVVIGTLTRDVRAASLLAFLVSLPIAALALVPSGAVSSGVYDLITDVSAIFPFKAALEALQSGLNDTGTIGAPLLHLAAIVLVYAGLARLALRRFAG